MTRRITDIVNEGEVLGVVGGVAASVAAADDQTAAQVPFTPAGSIASTNVQAAIVELDTEKATAAQGALADSAVQPGDNVTTLGSGAATDGYVATADGAGGIAWEAASGGGGSTSIKHKLVTPTSGNTSISTGSAWANLATHVASFTDLTLTAAAGDVIAVSVSGLWGNQGTVGFLDVATIVSSTLTNYVSSGTSTPAASGVRPWFGQASAWMTFGVQWRYTVQAGDVSAGSVTMRPRVNTSGAKTLFHDPGQFTVTNLGPVAV